MNDIREKFKNNAVVIASFIILIMLVTLLIGAFGIPFLGDSPQTYDAEDVVSFVEEDDKIVVSIDKEEAKDNTVVKSNGEEYQWNNGKVEIPVQQKDSIEVETYSQNELYDELKYNYNKHGFRIISPDKVLTSKNTTITSKSNSGSIKDVNWFIDGNVISVSDQKIKYKFDEPREYTVKAETQIDGRIYKKEKIIESKKPGSVILDIVAEVEGEDRDINLNETQTNESDTNGNNTNNSSNNTTEVRDEIGRDEITVKVYEEIEFNSLELTNNGISRVTYRINNNTSKSMSINKSVNHWYEEPGTYNVSVRGEYNGNISVDTIDVIVKEREDEVETRDLGLSLFKESGGVITGAKVRINDSLKVKTTDSSGKVKFNLKAYGDYNVKINESGIEKYNETIYLGKDNVVNKIRLDEVSNESGELSSDVNQTAGLNQTEAERQVQKAENQTENGTRGDIEYPELEEILNESVSGNGTKSDPYIITNTTELQAIQADTSGKYKLGEDINAISTRAMNRVNSVKSENLGYANKTSFNLDRVDSISGVVKGSVDIRVSGREISSDKYTVNYNTGSIEFSEKPSSLEGISKSENLLVSYNPSGYYKGFDPIEVDGSSITIDGDGHQISSMYINRINSDNVGIFNDVGNADIKNIQIASSSVYGSENVGIISGKATSTNINNAEIVSSEAAGDKNVGLITGTLSSSELKESVVTSVSGDINYVSAKKNAGGLVGNSVSSIIRESSTDQLTNVYSETNGGGIAGRLVGNSEIIQTSHRGSSSGDKAIGGLIGYLSSNSFADESYASVDIEDKDSHGSVIGESNGKLTALYWDSQVSNNNNAIGSGSSDTSNVYNRITNEMKNDSPASMSKFNFEDIWSDIDGEYPRLFSDTAGSVNYDLTVNVTDSENEEILNSVVEIDYANSNKVRVLEGESLVTFPELGSGDVEITVTSSEGVGYTPYKNTIQLNSDKYVNARLTEPSDVETKIVLTDISNNEITGADVNLDGTTKESNPATYSSLETGRYDISISGASGFEDITKDDYLIDRYRPEFIKIELDSSGGSYSVDSVSDTSITGQYANINSELENEVVEDASTGELNLTLGQRYQFDLSGTENPNEFELVSGSNNVLLSKQGTGTFNNDRNVNFDIRTNSVAFTATENIISSVGKYRTSSEGSSSNINTINKTQTMDVAVEKFKLRNEDDITVRTDPLVEESDISLIKDGKEFASKTGGSVEFTGIPRDTYQITADVDGFEEEFISDVSISDGDSYTIDLTPRESNENANILVSGTSSDKNKLGGDKVTFEDIDKNRNITKTLEDGSDNYDISVPEGTYDINYDSDDFLKNSLQTEEVTVSSGNDNEVNLNLKDMFTLNVDVVSDGSAKEVQYIDVVEPSSGDTVSNIPVESTSDGSTDGVSSFSIGKEQQIPDGQHNVEVTSLRTKTYVHNYEPGDSRSVTFDLTSKRKGQVNVTIDNDPHGGGADNEYDVESGILNSGESNGGNLLHSSYDTHPVIDDSESEVNDVSGISWADVRDGNTIKLYKGVEYNIHYTEIGGFDIQNGAALLDSNDNELIVVKRSDSKADYITRPAPVSDYISTWSSDGFWNKSQVNMGIRLDNSEGVGGTSTITFTPTDKMEESPGSVDRFVIKHNTDDPVTLFETELKELP